MPVCGNGIGEDGESCDGLDLNGQTCQSAGFLYGELGCNACGLDTSGCTNSRFVDNGDGTVTDYERGLMWEKKTDNSSIHDKDNLYTWCLGGLSCTSGGGVMDGTLATAFLGVMNGPTPFAGHDDWRLPTINELKSLLDNSFSSPKIDQTIFGPTLNSLQWSSSIIANSPLGYVWTVSFAAGFDVMSSETASIGVRAVRPLY